MAKAESIQYQAALAVTGAWQGSTRSKLYEELGWESLSDRHWCRHILQVHNILNNITLSSLKDKLPTIRKPLYSRTNYNIFHEIRFTSLREMNTFFPDAIISWNNIIKHFKILFVLRPKVFLVLHDPSGLRYLFQLRVNLSPLRSHKSHHNFLDTHSDIFHCNQGIDDASHFHFACPSFVTQGATLVISVIEVLQRNNLNQSELYLYGSINVIGNRKILFVGNKIYKGYSTFCILNPPQPPPPTPPPSTLSPCYHKRILHFLNSNSSFRSLYVRLYFVFV